MVNRVRFDDVLGIRVHRYHVGISISTMQSAPRLVNSPTLFVLVWIKMLFSHFFFIKTSPTYSGLLHMSDCSFQRTKGFFLNEVSP
jgi:hypothetical protein